MERSSQTSRGGYPSARNEIRVNGKIEPDLPNDPFKIAVILRERRSAKGHAKSVKDKIASDLRKRGQKP